MRCLAASRFAVKVNGELKVIFVRRDRRRKRDVLHLHITERFDVVRQRAKELCDITLARTAGVAQRETAHRPIVARAVASHSRMLAVAMFAY
jgi:hypothetical protein